jgi:hypothetical protein
LFLVSLLKLTQLNLLQGFMVNIETVNGKQTKKFLLNSIL